MEEQEFEKATVKQVALKWGLILGVILIGYNIVILMAGLVGNEAFGWLAYVLIAVIIYLAHKAFKDEGDGYMSYGQALGLGTLLSVIGAAISSLFMYMYLKFIDDSMIGILLEKQYDKMAEKGMPEDQIDKAMEMTSSFMTPEVILVMGILATVFFAFIISLIVSAITKNADPSMEV